MRCLLGGNKTPANPNGYHFSKTFANDGEVLHKLCPDSIS